MKKIFPPTVVRNPIIKSQNKSPSNSSKEIDPPTLEKMIQLIIEIKVDKFAYSFLLFLCHSQSNPMHRVRENRLKISNFSEELGRVLKNRICQSKVLCKVIDTNTIE